jgi:hypothetical protein
MMEEIANLSRRRILLATLAGGPVLGLRVGGPPAAWAGPFPEPCAILEKSMPVNHLPQAELTTVATFPPQFFLENLVMRADRSLLITVLNRGELWYVPPVD